MAWINGHRRVSVFCYRKEIMGIMVISKFIDYNGAIKGSEG